MFQSMTLTQYGRMAEKHWREFLPNRVRELEAKSQLQEALYEAEEKTKDEMDQTMRDFRKQEYTPQQAHDTAWEIIRERYILLPPEQP
jgi:cation transport regulator ChaB